MIDSRLESHLRRENFQLKQQLKDAHGLISNLRLEIELLRKQLSKYETESTLEDEHLRTPKIQKMNVEQHFEGSSEQEAQNSIENSHISPKLKIHFSPLTHSSNISNRYHYNSSKREQQPSRINLQVNKSSSKKVIINDDTQIYKRKEINKVLKKSSERNKDGEFGKDNQSPYKPMTSREIPPPSIIYSREFTSVKSQKVIRKESTSCPIFQYFFVTGMTKDGPIVTYSFPHGTGHKFDGYLSLMYGENSIRHPDLTTSSSKSKIVINTPLKENPFSIYIKDTFVIPIIKPEAKNSGKDYLIVCEVEESMIEKEFSGCYFPRYYCFVSQWKFFTEFRKLISQLIDRIHIKKKAHAELNEMIFTKVIQEEVEQGISFLHQKSIDYNKTLDCCIGASGLKFSAEVPPIEMSYQMIERYQRWEIINSMVQFRLSETSNPIDTELFGVLVAYALAEMKIVLYSSVKSKISEAIMQLLEIIRPLTYVNPILMATLKDEHENYLDAPMSIILGLWVEQRKSSRQKIEIYMNKKLNLTGLIEKAVLSVSDGIIINLDTGLIFGGGIKSDLIQIACKLNTYRKKFTRSRETYKMIEKMLSGKFESDQSRQIWQSLMRYVSNTQGYCYYVQNKER